jgi:hypothetical protein
MPPWGKAKDRFATVTAYGLAEAKRLLDERKEAAKAAARDEMDDLRDSMLRVEGLIADFEAADDPRVHYILLRRLQGIYLNNQRFLNTYVKAIIRKSDVEDTDRERLSQYAESIGIELYRNVSNKKLTDLGYWWLQRLLHYVITEEKVEGDRDAQV